MGWAHCGTDSDGREIGYAISATCDYPGCSVKINRGLSHACGEMHHGEGHIGDGETWFCEKYFCWEHLFLFSNVDGEYAFLCPDCTKAAIEQEENDD